MYPQDVRATAHQVVCTYQLGEDGLCGAQLHHMLDMGVGGIDTILVSEGHRDGHPLARSKGLGLYPILLVG